jgi:aspartyl-tRNA(Asn)/glutamyl-tRNA(Gln) amidotransferase subunit C
MGRISAQNFGFCSQEGRMMNVEEIASIARIELTEEEKKKFSAQMETILAYVNRLREVDVEQVEPFNQVHRAVNVWREDEVQRGLARDEVLKNAPQHRDGQIVVPKVIEGA